MNQPRWALYGLGATFLVGTSAFIGLAASGADTTGLGGYLAFVASLIVAGVTYILVSLTSQYVRLTRDYVQTSRQNLELLQEQWAKEREVRPLFWLQKERQGAEFEYLDDHGNGRRLMTPCVSVHISNFCQQSFKIVGGSVRRHDSNDLRKLRNPQLVVTPNGTETFGATGEVVRCISGSGEECRYINWPPETVDVEVALLFDSSEGRNLHTKPELFRIAFTKSRNDFAITEVR